MRDGLSKLLRASTEPRFQNDWDRQRRTASDILERLKTQEGIILADEVGMGKTYVALAVAVSQILSAPQLGQVVIFVPSAVGEKWVREWGKFSDSLLEHQSGIRCVAAPLRRGEDLLRALESRREQIVVVTHTALTVPLKDTFIQLALLYYATRRMSGGVGEELRQRIAKWCNGADGLVKESRFNTQNVQSLFKVSPVLWRAEWERLTKEELLEIPVPASLKHAIRHVNLKRLREAIEALPIRSSNEIERRLEHARVELAAATQEIWKRALSSINLDLPLLIVDEAHRLKNDSTRVSKLFSTDQDEEGPGAFNGIFRRMLFMTATPFELRHSELIRVLKRIDAVRPLDPPPPLTLTERLSKLDSVLTAAQANAVTFDAAWSRLVPTDLGHLDAWNPVVAAPASLTEAARAAWEQARLAVRARREMYEALRPWVIRHVRAHRRVYHAGRSILAGHAGDEGGLEIPESASLPFLLAARAQSVAVDVQGAGRPLFAYGIASSYEAYGRLAAGEDGNGRDTDEAADADTRQTDGAAGVAVALDTVSWYRREIGRALAGTALGASHPKVSATIAKAAQLWLEGEKCLIFCWFIKTGETVDHALAKLVDTSILKRASLALGIEGLEETRAELDRISERLFRSDRPPYQRIRSRLLEALAESSGGYEDVRDLIVDTAIRHLRTPSYLVRYVSLSTEVTDADVWAGINGANARGIDLLGRWRSFAERLVRARRQIEELGGDYEGDSEFSRVRKALLGADIDDDSSAGRGASLHPVRRASGKTKQAVRERLIALFNTPFAPDLLVASSVMGEGIDLHQECRYVIHHDLDWNPGVLEQRTGRLDRIGALAEREGKHIEVYEPYLAGTHDEKMFRVVKDRSQWFDVVMGRPAGSEESETDKEEGRLPLHEKIHDALRMDLRSLGNKSSN
ncbi:hypothetical protein J2W32_005970 [Variovorax boronicumulans]|uniref:Helicase n=1 Tax=Variovorax boronicumulans TaxID=436515 RepID=A0AAW8DBR9_9BURK|nr:DEAD/DEAH box helicase [Variovorax boronicumulans]MDP9896780.1 hypothetical protein [Variovorax boronicumulans]MDQ0056896.1 hypothetical protein [Variovorax boronicumulans]